MKKLIYIVILVLAALQLWSLDPVYHNNEEIIAELDSLEQIYSDIMMVRYMGDTATDSQPVYAVKISDNVEVDEDEPAVLFLGQCHAEEVMGVEISMYMINEILLYRNANPFRTWIENIEIWIWPTHNPEGLQVVTDEWDESFRKNKRDNNLNGVFDFVDGVGQDLDGVDLNRNYDFNWVHSDTLYDGSGNEPYDYYRGPEPFSEMEAQYVKQLSDEQHFIYSVAWHSSRTGTLSEKIYYPWNWEQAKPCVDIDFISDYADHVAHLIPNQQGTGYYLPLPTEGRNSKAHDWFYNEYGTLQFEIEAGTSNLQPGPDLLLDTIERVRYAPYYMMNRVLGYNADSAMLTGHVTDAETGNPLRAEYIIEERTAPSFTPRLCDELYGRFWWQCESGGYTLRIRHKGYADSVQSVSVLSSMWTTRDVALQPLPAASLAGSLNLAGESAEVTIIARHEMGDEYFVFPAGSTDYELDWWEGPIELTVLADGYVPEFVCYDLTEGENIYDLSLTEEVVIFSEDWTGDFSQWAVDGDWYIGIDEDYNLPFAKDTPARFYTNGSMAYLEMIDYVNLHGGSDLVLSLLQKYHTEHGYDFCEVQISTGGNNWQTIASYSGVEEWHRDYINLEGYQDNFVKLRFMLVTDNSLDDPGWWLGDIKLVSATAVEKEENELSSVTQLGNVYPNPFVINNGMRSESVIEYSLGTAGEVELSVYNLKGQKVKSLISEYLESGNYRVSWNGRNAQGRLAGSGVYFYQLKTEQEVLNKKLILIK